MGTLLAWSRSVLGDGARPRCHVCRCHHWAGRARAHSVRGGSAARGRVSLRRVRPSCVTVRGIFPMTCPASALHEWATRMSPLVRRPLSSSPPCEEPCAFVTDFLGSSRVLGLSLPFHHKRGLDEQKFFTFTEPVWRRSWLTPCPFRSARRLSLAVATRSCSFRENSSCSRRPARCTLPPDAVSGRVHGLGSPPRVFCTRTPATPHVF